jgi:hypothetical protein
MQGGRTPVYVMSACKLLFFGMTREDLIELNIDRRHSAGEAIRPESPNLQHHSRQGITFVCINPSVAGSEYPRPSQM